MNPAWYGAIGVVVAALITGLLARWTKKVDRADIAKKVSEAWDPVFERYDKDIERLERKCDSCKDVLDLVRKDFGSFIDRVETWVPLLPEGDAQREGRVTITAARQSHLSHNR